MSKVCNIPTKKMQVPKSRESLPQLTSLDWEGYPGEVRKELDGVFGSVTMKASSKERTTRRII